MNCGSSFYTLLIILSVALITYNVLIASNAPLRAGFPNSAADPFQENDDPVIKMPLDTGRNSGRRRLFHTAVTASDSVYNTWQCRIMYYWFKKFQNEAGSEMGGFTRVLHSGKADAFMDEIPTFVAQPLPDGMDQGYIVLNRPWAFVQWLEQADIQEEYILMSEPDHIIVKPIPNLSRDRLGAAFPFFYIEPRKYESVLRKFYPEEKGPITNIDPIGNSPVIVRKKFWKDYWKMAVPRKVKIFGWRGVHAALPTGISLHRRGLENNVGCGECGYKIETYSHVFLHCWFARAIWDQLGIPELSALPASVSFADIIHYSWSHFTYRKRHLVLVTLWLLWYRRNKRKHGDSDYSLNELVYKATNLTRTFAQYDSKYLSSMRYLYNSDFEWKKPPAGFLKLNCDASWKESVGGGIGIVVRDSGGNTLAVRALNKGADIRSSVVCEGLALLESFRLAENLKADRVIFETDCAEIVKWFNICPDDSIAHEDWFKDLLKKIAPTWMNVSLAMKKDPEADKAFGWVLEMYGYAVASALHGVGNILRKDFMLQPPWDTEIGEKFIIHYTYGCDYDLQGKLTYGKIGEWRFDKRSYDGIYPPRDLPLPPPGVPESVVTLVKMVNEATANIPNWGA